MSSCLLLIRLGKSSPYVIVKYDKTIVMKTKVIKNSLNPIWNESTILKNTDRNAILNLELYDKDHMK